MTPLTQATVGNQTHTANALLFGVGRFALPGYPTHGTGLVLSKGHIATLQIEEKCLIKFTKVY